MSTQLLSLVNQIFIADPLTQMLRLIPSHDNRSNKKPVCQELVSLHVIKWMHHKSLQLDYHRQRGDEGYPWKPPDLFVTLELIHERLSV